MLPVYTIEMRDRRQVSKDELRVKYPAQHFNDTCKEGYDLLTNILNMPPRDGETEALRKDRAIRGRLMKISAIEILDVLF
jgi:hypothetical protein